MYQFFNKFKFSTFIYNSDWKVSYLYIKINLFLKKIK